MAYRRSFRRYSRGGRRGRPLFGRRRFGRFRRSYPRRRAVRRIPRFIRGGVRF
jgi:hypothetical protein